MLIRLPVAVCLLAFAAASQSAEPLKAKAAPDLGFDYQSPVNDHMKFIAEGNSEKAVGVIVKHSLRSDTLSEAVRVQCQKKYAAIFGTAGKALDHEIVGYKKISSRITRIYAISHYEKFAITYVFTFIKSDADEWKISLYSISDGIEELEKVVPFVRIPSE